MVWCTLIAAMFLSLSALPSEGQTVPAPDAAFLAIVDTYREGRMADAIGALSQWPEARVHGLASTRDRLRELGGVRVKAAIMLHTDVAFALSVAHPTLSNRHVDLARALTQGLAKTPAGSLFKERWLATAVVVYLFRRDLRLAQFAVNLALDDGPDGRDLLLIGGTLLERRALAASSDIRGQWTLDPAIRGRMEHDLLDAAQRYERALQMDADFFPARLRLGWVHLINRSLQRAREQLTIVRDHTTEADIAYLAHLMLGALEEREMRPEAALMEYEAAHAIAPEAQTGRVAVIHAARAAGKVERARALAAEISERPAMTVDDPWWYFSFGLTGAEALRWLRDEALAR